MNVKTLAIGWRAYLSALLGGAMLPLALAPWDFWPIAIVSCATLAALLYQQPLRQCFWRSFWFASGMFGVGTSWVFVSIHHYGNAPLPLAVLLTALFTALMAALSALPFTLLGAPLKAPALNRSSAVMLLSFPALWLLNEWWRSWIFTGFPWLWLGYGHLDSPLTGLAPISGALSLGWIIAWCGALLFALTTRPAKPILVIHGVALALLFSAGTLLKNRQWTHPSGVTWQVALVQPAVPQLQRWDPDFLDNIIKQNLALTAPLWGNDLIIWPESSIPALMHRVTATLRELDKQGKASNTALITGMPSYNFDTKHYHNQVLQLGSEQGVYVKQHLVPFGEFLPFETLLRGLIDFFNLPMSSFASGPSGQAQLEVNGHKIGTAICYEIIYPELVRQISRNADVLLTVSNDTWFGTSIGPLQHMQMAQMRALELNKPLLRATNDGVTAFVDSQGRIQSRLPQFAQGTLVGNVILHQGLTPFAKIGQWLILGLALLQLLIGFLIAGRDQWGQCR